MKTALLIFICAIVVLAVPGGIILGPWIAARWKRKDAEADEIVGDVPNVPKGLRS